MILMKGNEFWLSLGLGFGFSVGGGRMATVTSRFGSETEEGVKEEGGAYGDGGEEDWEERARNV